MEDFVYFLVSTGLFILAWMIYLALNNLIDRLPPGWAQELLGGAISFALLISVGVILYFFSLSFFRGALLVIAALALFYAGRALVRRKNTSAA